MLSENYLLSEERHDEDNRRQDDHARHDANADLLQNRIFTSQSFSENCSFLPGEVEHLGETEVRVSEVAFHLTIPDQHQYGAD